MKDGFMFKEFSNSTVDVCLFQIIHRLKFQENEHRPYKITLRIFKVVSSQNLQISFQFYKISNS